MIKLSEYKGSRRDLDDCFIRLDYFNTRHSGNARRTMFRQEPISYQECARLGIRLGEESSRMIPIIIPNDFYNHPG